MAERETLRTALWNRRMLICVFIGFTSGLPLYVLATLVPAWLRSEHVDLKSIGLFTLIQFPYTWKFLWSPLVDRYALPMGRRRGWMLFTQILLVVTLAAFGVFNPTLDLWSIAYLATTIAIVSATQDIAIDAYRRELLPDPELGLGNAVHVNAYRVASLVPGSLALVLSDHLPWTSVFIVTALFMLPGIATTLLVHEPDLAHAHPKTLTAATVDPFREFINRAGWKAALLTLAFIFLYKLGDALAVSLATPFYLDLGYSKTQIGLVAKNAGFWPSIAGGIVGGIWMVKLGINRALWLFGVIQVVSILGFAWLAHQGNAGNAGLVALALVIGFEAVGVGLGSVALVAFMSRATNPLYTATQYALFASLAAVPRTLVSASAGWVVERIGWYDFFLLCTALAVPGMLLLWKVAPWNGDSKSLSASA
jgi:PAT family beta-lactamase induction signal transducer AmpG